MINSYYLFFLFLFIVPICTAQNKIPDSLKTFSFDETKKRFYKEVNDENFDLAKVYANAYINKGKSKKDTLQIASGYRLFTFIVKPKVAIIYADSAIHITKNKVYKNYPSEGYILKGYYLYNIGLYNDALDNYLTALSYAVNNNHTKQQLTIRQAIGILKNRFGDYKESLKIFKEHYNYIKALPNYRKKYTKEYLLSIFNIYTNFLRSKKLDSANLYIEKGISESLKLKDSSFYYDFVAAAGYSAYYNKKFKIALDSLNKAAPFLENYSLAINMYYKGKSYENLKKYDQVLKQFMKADSIYNVDKDLFPELRDIYEFVIDFYKKKKDKDKQLFYLEKLLGIDSILDKQNNHLSSKITKKYDTPLLLKEKQELISSLRKKNQRSYIGLIISSSLALLIGIFLIYYIKLQKKYKQKFIDIIDKTRHDKKEPVSKIEIDKNAKKLGINQEIINSVLDQLTIFENDKIFLNNNITVASLAKKFNTNTTYLSKIINAYRGKKFSTYLKELRINYVVEQLQTNTIFRKYSVKSIAYEVGFNNVDHFSRVFNEITGIKPSYFIKQLEKIEKTN